MATQSMEPAMSDFLEQRVSRPQKKRNAAREWMHGEGCSVQVRNGEECSVHVRDWWAMRCTSE